MIQRYNPGKDPYGDIGPHMEESDTGEYVRVDDLRKIVSASDLDALERMIDRMQDSTIWPDRDTPHPTLDMED
jgi:hypothetical protein